MSRSIVIVSNRGPLSFTTGVDGRFVARRGAGGLVSGLAPLVTDHPTATWLAAALSDADRAAAQTGPVEADGLRVHLVAMDPEAHRLAYDVVCNQTLWYAVHEMFDTTKAPVFDRAWWEAWAAYRTVNRAFAEAAAEAAPEGAAVLMQDYHVALAGPILARARPDLRIVHFSHTPFAGPDALRVLPPAVRGEWLTAMAAHHACGFHTARWADAFEASCAADGVPPPKVFVSPLAPDPEDLKGVASSEECAEAVTELDRQLGDRLLLARVDRIEPSKNIVRGFLAFDALLDTHPEWRGRVVFGAFVYPSREALSAYRNYRTDVEGIITRLNARWGTDDWTPVHYDPSDHFPRSVAALRRADVLLVNPLRDGLNLVAKEGAMVNERDAVVVLSTEAGAWDELAADVIGVHPFDIVGTAEALHTALSMPSDERAALADRLRARSAARTPADWLREQLAAAR